MSNENEARVPAGSPEGGQWTTYIMESKAGVQRMTTNEGPAKAEAMLREKYKWDVGEVKHVNNWPQQAPRGGTLEDRQNAVFHKTFTRR